MKAVIQLVSRASVTVEREDKREIGPGYVILLGVAQGDTEEIMKKMVKRSSTCACFRTRTVRQTSLWRT